jgi:hypothetical protein
MNKVVLVLGMMVLAGCGGGDTSGEDDRRSVQCTTFSPGLVNNSCDFATVVRTFGGTSTPVTVPANSSVTDPDATILGVGFGSCRAPFTPVDASPIFNCQ